MLKDQKAGTGQERDEDPQTICYHFTRTLWENPLEAKTEARGSGMNPTSLACVVW